MARILQCLICITVMMTTARTQSYFYHQTYQAGILNTQNPYEGQLEPQARNLHEQPISENQSRRSEEARKQRIETRTPQGVQRIENGTYKILNRLQLNKRGALEETLTSPNDRVVFPGPTSNTPNYPLEIPEECRRKGFCDNVPDYPSEFVNKLIAKLGNAVKFQMDTLDEKDIQIAQRLGGTGTDQEIELCNFTEKVVHPQSAPDKDDKWYTVINSKDNPVQGFRIETCNNMSSSCNPIATIQEGYKASCKQKYVYRLMEVIDENKNHVQKSLKLPSCCSCVITVNDPFRR